MLSAFPGDLIGLISKYRLLSSYKDELYHYLHDEKLKSSNFKGGKLKETGAN